MHPALPSGVHLKALETYDLIFKRIGTKGLAQDLFIYSAGILPLLGNAAMPVKPVLLGIYESYFLGLGKALLPGLPGVVLGLLPGIEEGSEYTERWDVTYCIPGIKLHVTFSSPSTTKQFLKNLTMSYRYQQLGPIPE